MSKGLNVKRSILLALKRERKRIKRKIIRKIRLKELEKKQFCKSSRSRPRKTKWSISRIRKIAACTICASTFTVTSAFALPRDAKVVNGRVSVSESGSTNMLIDQQTDKAIVNWRSFSINKNELVSFNQPSVSSVILNRVVGASPSNILGKLQANGRVFIVNPNGIVFGKSAQVDVAGLVASTLDIKDSDFLSGKYIFNQDPDKALSYIINEGTIEISNSGFVCLVAPSVSNEGLIVAKLGKVVMASGEDFSVDFFGDGLITYSLSGKVEKQVVGPDKKILKSGLSNSGSIKANGGEVLLTADAAEGVFSSVVNNSGLIEAKSILDKNGNIILAGGSSGTVKNAGTLDISSNKTGSNTGEISITGASVENSGTIIANGEDGSPAGKIRLYSENLTKLDSTSNILADGIGKGSDGGFLEINSKGSVLLNGSLGATSQFGKEGKVLVRPYSLNISTNQYSGGSNLDFEAISTITVGNNVVISTRHTEKGASDDQLKASSVGNSGNLVLKAPNINIEKGAELLTFAGDKYSSGKLQLIASNAGDPLYIWGATNIDIKSDVLFDAGDVDISSSSNAHKFFGKDSNIEEVPLDFLGKVPVPGGDLVIKPSSKITIGSGSKISGNHITITSEATAISKVTIVASATVVTYAHTRPTATIDIKGDIVASKDVSISSDAEETLSSSAKTVNLGKGKSKGSPVDVSIACGYSNLISKVTVEKTSLISGTDINISSQGDKDISVSSSAGAYENGKAGMALSVSRSSDDVESSVCGSLSSPTGDINIISVLNSNRNKISSGAGVGSGLVVRYILKAANLGMDKIKNFLSENTPKTEKSSGVSKLALSAALTVVSNHSTVKSFVAPDGKVTAKNDVSIKSDLDYKEGSTNGIQTSAISSVDTNKDNSKKYAVSGAIDITNTTDDVEAYIGSNAEVNAHHNIEVNSAINMPYEITWYKIKGASDVINKINSNLGLQSGFFTTWAQTTSGGTKVGLAGGVNIAIFNETSKAYIDSNAKINQDTGYTSNPASVQVTANNDIETLNLGGKIALTIPLGYTGKVGVGGIYLGVYYNVDTEASIYNNALVRAKDLLVKAKAQTNSIMLGVAGTKGERFAVNGVFSYLSLDDKTLSNIYPNAHITSGNGYVDENLDGSISPDEDNNIVISSQEHSLLFNLAGNVAMSKSIGMGLSLGITKVYRDVESELSGKVVSDGNIYVKSENGGIIVTASLAGAVVKNTSFIGSNPLKSSKKSKEGEGGGSESKSGGGSESKSEAVAGSKSEGDKLPTTPGEKSKYKASTGIAVAGDSSINDIHDTTKAYIDGNAKVSTPKYSVTLKSNELTFITAVGGVAALSKASGTSAGIAGSYIDNYIDDDTESYIDDASVSSLFLALSSNDFDHIIGIAAGGAIVPSSKSVSLAGSVVTDIVDDKTYSFLENSSITMSKNSSVSLTSYDNSNVYTVAGDLSVSGLALGASIAINDINKDVEVYSDASDISTDYLSLHAYRVAHIVDISVSASAAAKYFAEAASISVNDVRGRTLSFISSKKNKGIKAKSILLKSLSNPKIIVVAGAASVSGKGVGIGASVAVNRTSNSIKSYISNDASIDTNYLKITSDSEDDVKMLSINAQLSRLSVGGNLIINYSSNDIDSYIDSSDVHAEDSIGIEALSSNNAILGGGTVGVSVGSKVSAGIGGSVVTNILSNTIKAYISNSSITANGISSILMDDAEEDKKDKPIYGLDIVADSRESVKTFADTGEVSVSKFGMGLAGSFSVNVLDDDTESYITSSTINKSISKANNNQVVDVKSFNYSDMMMEDGAVSVTTGASAGVASDVTVLKNTTESYISDHSTVNAKKSVDVTSNAKEHLSSAIVAAPETLITLSVAGSLEVLYSGNVINAYIDNSCINSDNLNVVAHDVIDIGSEDNKLSGFWVGCLSGSVILTGCGISVSVVDIKDTTKAYLLNSTAYIAGNTNISASSDKFTRVLGLCGGFGLVGGLTGDVSVDSISTDTEAYIGGDVSSNYYFKAANISSSDNNKLNDIAGSVDLSGGYGVGGTVDVISVHDTTASYVKPGTFINDHTLNINSITSDSIESKAIGFGIDTFDVTGTVSVVNVGSALDKDESNAVGDSDNIVSSTIKEQSDTSTGYSSTNSDTSSNINNISVSDDFSSDSVLKDTTSSYIGSDANIISKGDISIDAVNNDSINTISGRAAATITAIGGSVAVQRSYGTAVAYVGNKAVISSGGNISVSSYSELDGSLYSVSGSLVAIAGVSGAVGYVHSGNSAYSYIDDGAILTDARTVTVDSKTVSSIKSNTSSSSGSFMAEAGLSTSVIYLNNKTVSYVGQDTVLGTISSPLENLYIKASESDSLNSDSIPLNAAAIAADAAESTINYNPEVKAFVGDNSYILLSGQLNSFADLYYNISSQATGIDLGLLSAGASVATSNINPYIESFIATGSNVFAHDVYIMASDSYYNGKCEHKSASYAESKAISALGGGLVGLNGSLSYLKNNGVTYAYIGNDVNLTASNILYVRAYFNTEEYSDATGVEGGIAAAGASLAHSDSSPTISSYIGKNSYISGKDIIITSVSYDLNHSYVLAGSGGIVSGNVAEACTSSGGISGVSIYDGSMISALKELNVISNKHLSFNSVANSINAAVLGASGAAASNKVSTDESNVDIGDNADITSYNILINAENNLHKNREDYNTNAGSGGVYSGAASYSKTVVDNTGSNIDIGNNVYLQGTGDTDSPGSFNISAYNNFYFYDEAQINTGGLASDAFSESDLVANDNVGSSVSIGTEDFIESPGNLNISSKTDATGEVHADTSVWGIACTGQAKSSISIDAVDTVHIHKSSIIRSAKEMHLLAGADTEGNGIISTTANTNVFDKSPYLYVGKPDADALSERYATIEIDSDSDVASGTNMYLTSTKGFLSASGLGKATDASTAAAKELDKLCGSKDVTGALDILAGTGKNEGLGKIIVNGDVRTGVFRDVYITFGSDFNPYYNPKDKSYNIVTYEYEDHKEHESKSIVPYAVVFNKSKNRWEYYKDGTDKSSATLIGALVPQKQSSGIRWTLLRDKVISNTLRQQIQRLENIDRQYGQANPTLSSDIESEIEVLKSEESDSSSNQLTDIIKIYPIFASSGDIEIISDDIVGKGELSAPGDVKVTIENHSPLPVEVGAITIPSDVGGHILFNGLNVYNNADIVSLNEDTFGPSTVNLSVESSNSSPPPSITISSDFATKTIESDSDPIKLYSPPLILGDLINSDSSYKPSNSIISNLGGSVTVTSSGSILAIESIFANSISLSASGSFIFNNPTSIYNIGPFPSSEFKDLEEYAIHEFSSKTIKEKYDCSLNPYPISYTISGNNILINAYVINIDGIIQSGIADKTIHITQHDIDELKSKVKNGYATLDVKPYLDYKSDVIKGGYKLTWDDKKDRLTVSDIEVRGGTVVLSGKIINTNLNGKINVVDGFGKIDIVNETDVPIVLQSINTGNIEGKVTIIDKEKHISGDKAGTPLITVYKRLGNNIEIYSNTKGDKTHATYSLKSIKDTRKTEYDPASNLVYFWMNGVATTTQKEVQYYHEYDKFLGFIPIEQRHFTKSDIVKGYPITEKLEKSQLPKGDFVYTSKLALKYGGYSFFSKTKELSNKEIYRTDSSGTHWYWWHHFVPTRKTWIARDTIYQTGSDTFYYNRVKANYPIGIDFIGYDKGEVNVSSKGNIIIHGGIINPNGNVYIDSSQGNIIASSDVPIHAALIDLSAANGAIGSMANPVTVTGEINKGKISNPTVDVSTGKDVYLTSINTGIDVSNISTAGDVAITSDKNIEVVGGYIKGKNISVTAKCGSISSGTDSNKYIDVDTDAKDGGKLSMSSTNGDIYVKEIRGDLIINKLKASGDVYVQVPDGSIIDGNPNKKVDNRTRKQLLALWDGMSLMGTKAEDKNSQQIKAYQNSMDRAYQNYWRDYRHFKVKTDGKYSYSAYDPNVKFQFTRTQIKALKASGWTDERISQYEGDMTEKYREWGKDGYDPKFSYTLSSSEKKMLSEGHSWSEDELDTPIPAFVFNKNASGTVYELEQPNIVADNVKLFAGDSIGIDKDDIVYNYSDPDKITEAEIKKIELALSAAERNDIKWEPDKSTLIIHQRDDVNVDVRGWIIAQAKNHIYLGSNNDIHIDMIKSQDKRVRLKVSKDIVSANGGNIDIYAPNGLILESSDGSIGTKDNPLSVMVGKDAPTVARALGDIYLINPEGSMYIDNIYSNSNVNISVPNGSVYDWLEDTESDITAKNITINAAEDVGLAGGYDKALDIDLTDPDGLLSIMSRNANIFSERPLKLGKVNLADEFTLNTLGSLELTDNLKASSIDIEADGDISLDKGTDIDVTKDTYIESKGGSLSLSSGDLITGKDGIGLYASKDMTLAGNIISKGDVYIKSGGALTGDTDVSGMDIDIRGNSYSNNGGSKLTSGKDISIAVEKGLAFGGSASAKDVSFSTLFGSIGLAGRINASNVLGITSGNNIKLSGSFNSGGDIDLTAGHNMSLSGNIVADNDLDLFSNANIHEKAGYLKSNYGSILIETSRSKGGQFVQDSTSKLLANGGLVSIDTNKNIDVSYISSGSEVDLTSRKGAINSGTIKSNRAKIDSSKDINISSITVDKLDASSKSGNIFIGSTKKLLADNIYSGKGDIELNVERGDVFIRTIYAKDGSVNVKTKDGSILNSNGDQNNIHATKKSSLMAEGGIIGTEFNPLNVDIRGGKLRVFASKVVDDISVNINGQILPDNILNLRSVVPPGFMLFNDRMIGGVKIDEVYKATDSLAIQLINDMYYAGNMAKNLLLNTVGESIFSGNKNIYISSSGDVFVAGQGNFQNKKNYH